MAKPLELFLVNPHHNLKQVMQKIDQNGYGIALVADEKNFLQGVVTDGDIRRSILKGISLDVPIATIMNPSFVSVVVGYSSEQILELMNQKLYRHIPVLDAAGKVQDLLLTDEIQRIIQRGSSSLFSPRQLVEHQQVLVIGGAGYIGSTLVRQLLNQGYAVRILDKLIFGKSAVDDLKNNHLFTLIEGDTSHLETVVTAVKDVDAVVHLAEIVGDPACALDPEKTQQMNYLSTITIANVCKHFQVNRFIYTSSCSVYGAGADPALLTERSHLSPVSLYARMKIESERALLNLADGFFSPTILRLATVFGVSPRMRFDLVVNTLTMKAVRENKITLFGGDQWRPNVHVSDVARSIIAVLEAPLTEVGGEIFNVGSNENNFTINQLGEFVKLAVPTAELVLEEKKADKRNYRVDFSKIQNLLGFKAAVNVPQGIIETAQALRGGNYADHANSIYYNDQWYKQHWKGRI